jgi:hypothetical protein
VSSAPAPAPRPFSARPSNDGFSPSALSGGLLLDTDFEFIKSQCGQFGVEVEDNRHKRGAFWVMVPDRTSRKMFTESLERLGFKFAPTSRGFWYKQK